MNEEELDPMNQMCSLQRSKPSLYFGIYIFIQKLFKPSFETFLAFFGISASKFTQDFLSRIFQFQRFAHAF